MNVRLVAAKADRCPSLAANQVGLVTFGTLPNADRLLGRLGQRRTRDRNDSGEISGCHSGYDEFANVIACSSSAECLYFENADGAPDVPTRVRRASPRRVRATCGSRVRHSLPLIFLNKCCLGETRGEKYYRDCYPNLRRGDRHAKGSLRSDPDVPVKPSLGASQLDPPELLTVASRGADWPAPTRCSSLAQPSSISACRVSMFAVLKCR